MSTPATAARSAAARAGQPAAARATLDRWGIAAIVLACASVAIWLPEGMTRWTWPKLLLMVVAIVCAALAARSGRLPRWAVGIGGGILVALLLATALAPTPWLGLWGRWPRYDGLLTGLPVYAGAVWLGARLLGPSAPQRARDTLNAALSIVALALAAVALFEAAGLRPIASDLERPGSLLGNATDQGLIGVLIAAVLLPSAAASAPRSGSATRMRWLTCSGLVAAALATVLSGSRAALLGFAVALLVLALGMLWRNRAVLARRDSWRVPAWAGGLLLASALAAMLVPSTLSRLDGSSPYSAGTVHQRWIMWADTLTLIASSPWTGVGPGGFLEAILPFQSRVWFAANPDGTVLDTPHNIVLELLAGGGVLLMLPIAGGVVLAVWHARHATWPALPNGTELTAADAAARARLGAAAAVLGYLAGLLTSFTAPGTLLLASVLLGSLIAVPAVGRSTMVQRAPSMRWASVALLTLWALGLGLWTAAEMPLQRAQAALAQGDIVGAHEQFEQASLLRPWDADIASIAAQSLAAAAAAGAGSDSAAMSMAWAERALERIPGSAAVIGAQAAAAEAAGDLSGAVALQRELVALSPLDPQPRVRLALLLALGGDSDSALDQLGLIAEEYERAPGVAELTDAICEGVSRPSCTGVP